MTTWTMEYLMENCWKPNLPFCWLLSLPHPSGRLPHPSGRVASEGSGAGALGDRYRFAPPAVLCDMLGVQYEGPWWEPDPEQLLDGARRYIGPTTAAEAIDRLDTLTAEPGPVLTMKPIPKSIHDACEALARRFIGA